MFKSLSNLFFGKLTKFRMTMIVLTGIFIGLSLTAFKLSNAVSYLSDKPEACINCHVMTPEYSTWFHSSHRENASCNDCHVPHENFARKYWFKANDGLRHASMFTFRLEPQVIQIKSDGKEVVQDNCIRCHENQISDVSLVSVNQDKHNSTSRKCWDCHREVPHGRVHGQAATPNARVPGLKSALPKWLKNDE